MLPIAISPFALKWMSCKRSDDVVAISQSKDNMLGGIERLEHPRWYDPLRLCKCVRYVFTPLNWQMTA